MVLRTVASLRHCLINRKDDSTTYAKWRVRYYITSCCSSSYWLGHRTALPHVDDKIMTAFSLHFDAILARNFVKNVVYENFVSLLAWYPNILSDEFVLQLKSRIYGASESSCARNVALFVKHCLLQYFAYSSASITL